MDQSRMFLKLLICPNRKSMTIDPPLPGRERCHTGLPACPLCVWKQNQAEHCCWKRLWQKKINKKLGVQLPSMQVMMQCRQTRGAGRGGSRQSWGLLPGGCWSNACIMGGVRETWKAGGVNTRKWRSPKLLTKSLCATATTRSLATWLFLPR